VGTAPRKASHDRLVSGASSRTHTCRSEWCRPWPRSWPTSLCSTTTARPLGKRLDFLLSFLWVRPMGEWVRPMSKRLHPMGTLLDFLL